MRVKTKKVPVAIPLPQLSSIDKLIDQGVFPDRGEAIRTGVRDLLERYHAAPAIA